MNDDTEKGLIPLLGLWLLFHEVADEWIKELIDSGKTSPEGERNVIEDLALKVNIEKENIKSYLAEKKLVSPSGAEDRKLMEKMEKLEFQMEELKNRFIVIERQLDRISER